MIIQAFCGTLVFLASGAGFVAWRIYQAAQADAANYQQSRDQQRQRWDK